MRQRAALRATGVSTRSLRCSVSETSSSKASLPSRPTTSIGASHRPLTKKSPNGKVVLNRSLANGRSVSMSQLKVSSHANQVVRNMGRGTSLTSVHETNSSGSNKSQHQLTDLREQDSQVQNMQDNGCHDDQGKSVTKKEIRNNEERRAQVENVEHDDVHESPPLSPKRIIDEFDTHSGSMDQVSLANTINSTGTHPSFNRGVTSSMLGALLTIPSMSLQAESPVSTTSTKKMELLQRYRTEQNSSMRSRKLEELRNFRRDRESQLLSMMHNQQEQAHINKQDETALDCTDVIAVIVNLRDELSAAQEVIEQQKTIMETLSSQEENRKKTVETPAITDSSFFPHDMVPLTQYQELQERFVKLQMDRAWGEFQLRDRITSDALKFHRRLRRWKDQTVELRCSLQNLENDHGQQFEAFKQKNEHQRQAAERDYMELLEAVQATADEKFRDSQKEYEERTTTLQQKADEYLEQSKTLEMELQELKTATQMAFDEFCDAKDRIEMLENELLELKGENEDSDREPHIEFPKKRLTRRSCKRDLLYDVEKDETKGEYDAASTRYWGSWFHRSSATAETKVNDETRSSSPPRKAIAEEEKVEEEKQRLPSRSALEGDKIMSRDESFAVDVEDNKAKTWSTWGLPKIFSEASRQDHELNLTD
jgi:hypothetical protein